METNPNTNSGKTVAGSNTWSVDASRHLVFYKAQFPQSKEANMEEVRLRAIGLFKIVFEYDRIWFSGQGEKALIILTEKEYDGVVKSLDR